MKATTILVIDDEQNYLDLITNTLKHKNFNVIIAVNGKMGLKVAQKFVPDIIICDWEMPVMNGIETIKQLKLDPNTEAIPVILATGIMTSSENLETALAVGAIDYIRKPIDIIELTARINTAIKFANSQKEIKFQHDKLKELNATKDKFFSIIAHDLRTPFNGILGFTELLKTNYNLYSDEQKQEMIAMVSTGAKKGYELLENMLIWARSQSNQISFEPLFFDINEVFETCFLEIQSLAFFKDQKIIQVPVKNLAVYGDKDLILFVLRNLLSNAIKFTPRNGEITISALETRNGIEISVKDTGIGILKPNTEKLFRIDSNYMRVGTEGEPSTGLGLVLCKEFIDKHGGTISIESEIGEGSTFKFTLPIKI